MNKEEGIVIKISADTAWVKTQRSGACESCSSKSLCGTLEGGKSMEVEAVNRMGAAEGDRVLITCETSSLLRISFLIYIFPIVCMVIGAVIGQQTAPKLNFDPSLFSAFLGFAFLALAFLMVRSIGRKMSADEKYKPRIARIL